MTRRKIKGIKNPEVLVGAFSQILEATTYNEIEKIIEKCIAAATITYEPEPIEFTQRWHENTGEMPGVDPDAQVLARFDDGECIMGCVGGWMNTWTETKSPYITHYTFDIFDPSKGGE